MKKYISIFALALVLGLGFASCNTETDEPAGGTAVEKMAGHWMVDIDAVDANGNPIDGGEHYFGYDEDRISLFTYNTADNSDTQIRYDVSISRTLIPFSSKESSHFLLFRKATRQRTIK